MFTRTHANPSHLESLSLSSSILSSFYPGCVYDTLADRRCALLMGRINFVIKSSRIITEQGSLGASIDRQFHVMTRLLRANYSAFYRRIERAPRIRSSTDNRPLLTLTVIYGDGERLPTWIAYLLVKLAIRGSIRRVGEPEVPLRRRSRVDERTQER